jgi:pimeloyl-ACP methyl ester carboxylesterase
MERMSDRYQLIAMDLFSHGKSDKAPSDAEDEFEPDVKLLSAFATHAGPPVHLVGHSMGGAVAARYAIRCPACVKSLAIYEPTLFQLLANGSDDEGWNDYMRLVTGMIDHLDAGNPDGASEVLVDYWTKPGTYPTLPAEQKAKITAGIAAGVAKVRQNLNDPTKGIINPSLIKAPTLLITGSASPRSARGVIDILSKSIDGAVLHRIEGAGHMAPLTHTDTVNSLIEEHIDNHTD